MNQTSHKMTAGSLVRAELARIAGRYEAADHRANAAGIAIAFGAATPDDRAAAEFERMEIAGEFLGLESELAHFALLLLRLAVKREPDALRQHLAEALRPELVALWEAVARLEVRR